MSVARALTLSVFVVSQMLALPASGVQQFVPTKTLLVKNPPSGARKVLWKVKGAATMVGDPTADGATLHIVLTNGGDQCVTMPSSGWSAIGTIGFRYKDTTLASGPVKVAQIKQTPSGTFLIKALLKNGGPTSIAVTPGDPTASYATNFTLGTGDEYCGGTATATPSPNDATTFKVSNDGSPAGCVASCLVTTTSTSTTSTSSTTSTTSPCAAQVGGFCWFLGASGEACDTACGTQGRVYDSATASYAGTGGSAANCQTVLNALLEPDPTFVGDGACGAGLGCFVGTLAGRCTDIPTNANDSGTNIRRVCACQ